MMRARNSTLDWSQLNNISCFGITVNQWVYSVRFWWQSGVRRKSRVPRSSHD